MSNPAGVIIGTILILFLIFLLLRELMCWYWKINKMSGQLGEISSKLSDITEQLYYANSVSTSSDTPQIATTDTQSNKPLKADEERCPFCAEASSKNLAVCEHCGRRKK